MKQEDKLLQQAIELNKQEKYSDVIQLLSEEILEKYNNLNFYIEKAQSYLGLEKYNECEILVKIALNIDSNNASVYFILGKINYSNENYYEAIKCFLSVIKLNSKFTKAYVALGNCYYYIKNYDNAIQYYEEALKFDPNYENAYIGLGLCASRKSENNKAIEFYSKAIELNPNSTFAYTGLGNTYLNIKDYDRALENYERALSIDKNYSFAYNGLGLIYNEKLDYTKAIYYYSKAIETDINYVFSYYNRGNSYFNDNSLEKSLEDYEKYINLTKEKSDIYYSFAIDRIEIIKKRIISTDFEKISTLVTQIKKMLLFDEICITHYTSISTASKLILGNSELRLSEGTFLNDTSEGKELFKFINLGDEISNDFNFTAETFTQKPFIGSFVAETKHNDLTLWRMYGKEGKEEAKGCAITLNKKVLIKNIKDKLAPDSKLELDSRVDEEYNFYKVAYLKDKQFLLSEAKEGEQDTLNLEMQKLVKAIEDFEEIPKKNKEYKKDIIEELNKIAYLFKSAEYQHENEVRLVVNIDYEKKINQEYTPPKVYIELVPIPQSIAKITIGPKVERADEWAAAFYHHLDKQGIKPEINISHLPFK